MIEKLPLIWNSNDIAATINELVEAVNEIERIYRKDISQIATDINRLESKIEPDSPMPDETIHAQSCPKWRYPEHDVRHYLPCNCYKPQPEPPIVESPPYCVVADILGWDVPDKPFDDATALRAARYYCGKCDNGLKLRQEIFWDGSGNVSFVQVVTDKQLTDTFCYGEICGISLSLAICQAIIRHHEGAADANKQ